MNADQAITFACPELNAEERSELAAYIERQSLRHGTPDEIQRACEAWQVTSPRARANARSRRSAPASERPPR